MSDRIGAVLKAVAIAFAAWFAVYRFLPSIPLSFIAHETAALPNALKEPVQGERPGEAFSETRRGRSFRVIRRPGYDVAARVASTERYRAGLSSDLLPCDFVLTWGAATREPAWSHVSYVQTGRFYNWSTHDLALDPAYVSSHTANTHLIAATGASCPCLGSSTGETSCASRAISWTWMGPTASSGRRASPGRTRGPAPARRSTFARSRSGRADTARGAGRTALGRIDVCAPRRRPRA